MSSKSHRKWKFWLLGGQEGYLSFDIWVISIWVYMSIWVIGVFELFLSFVLVPPSLRWGNQTKLKNLTRAVLDNCICFQLSVHLSKFNENWLRRWVLKSCPKSKISKRKVTTFIGAWVAPINYYSIIMFIHLSNQG